MRLRVSISTIERANRLASVPFAAARSLVAQSGVLVASRLLAWCHVASQFQLMVRRQNANSLCVYGKGEMLPQRVFAAHMRQNVCYKHILRRR